MNKRVDMYAVMMNGNMHTAVEIRLNDEDLEILKQLTLDDLALVSGIKITMRNAGFCSNNRTAVVHRYFNQKYQWYDNSEAPSGCEFCLDRELTDCDILGDIDDMSTEWLHNVLQQMKFDWVKWAQITFITAEPTGEAEVVWRDAERIPDLIPVFERLGIKTGVQWFT